MVHPGQPVPDTTDFRTQYDPGNPAADKSGYVKLPNVNPLIEIMDMREAQRSYEADLTVMEASKVDAGAHRRSAEAMRARAMAISPAAAASAYQAIAKIGGRAACIFGRTAGAAPACRTSPTSSPTRSTTPSAP